MKRITALACIASLLALLRSEPVYAIDVNMFNAATGNVVSVPAVISLGGDMTCELKIDSASTSEVVVTIYSAAKVDPTTGAMVSPAVWYSVTNPINGDPDNHLVGSCPAYAGGIMSGYVSGAITVTLRSKR